MLFTLTDRNYNVLDAYETDDYLIGIYTGYIIKTLDLNVSVDDDRVSNWIAGAYIFCKDSQGYAYWFTIRTVEEGAYKDSKTITAYSGTLDILNEDANPVFRPSEAQPFSYYFDKIFYDTGIELGVNEIEGMNRTLEFTSENASNVEMLQYVLNGFDNAEGDLVVDMVGSVPTKVSLNVYKRIGRESSQALVTDQDDSLTELSRMSSIEELATCLNPVGENEDDVDNPITLVGKYYEELDENGDVLYYSPENDARIYSVKGREKFFVKLPNKNNGEFDGYINRRYVSEAKTQDALWSASLAQLKKIDNVQVEYEVKGDINCRAGDNVTIVSHQMKPPVMLSARLMEYKFNDDNPSRNEYTFGNYQELESQMDQLAQIMAEIKKSIITVTSQITAYALSDDGVEPPVTGWSEEYTEPSVGKWLWTRIVTSLSNGNETTAYSVSRIGEVTFTNDNPPVNPKESDKWYKETVDDTEYLIYIDGTWQPITSKAEINKITEDIETAMEEVEQAKQDAIDKANQAYEDAKAHADAEVERINTALSTDIGGAIETAEQAKADAVSKANQALADAKTYADAEVQASKEHFDNLIEGVESEVADAQATADSAVEQIDTAVANAGFTSLDETINSVRDIASGVKSELDIAIQNAGFTSLDDTLQNMNNITSSAEYSAQQAIDNASNAYGLAQTSISEAQTAQANSLAALANADDALDGVSNLDVRVDEVEAELELKADNTFMNEDGTLTTLSNAITFNANKFSSDMSRIESRVESLAGEINLVILKDALVSRRLFGGEVYPNATAYGGSDTMREMINVVAGEQLALSKDTVGGDNTWRISFYNNVTYVTRITSESNQYVMTVPAGVNKMWVSYPSGCRPQIVRGSTIVPYRPNIADQMTTNEMVLFRNEYDEFADQTARRLTAIDSSGGRLEVAETIITQTADGLQTTVGKVDSQGTRLSAVEQTAQGLQSTVADKANQSQVTQLALGLQSTVGKLADFIYNSTFEDGSLLGWEGITVETSDPNSPTKYYAALRQRDAYFGSFTPVEAGEELSFSITAWNISSNPQQFTFGVAYYDKDKNIVSRYRAVNTSEPIAKKTYTGKWTASSSAVYVRPWVHIDAYSSFTSWFFTNPKVSRVATNSKITQLENSVTTTIASMDGRIVTQQISIDTISSTVSGHDGRLSTVEQTAQGLQSTVANKASQSQVTQLANVWNASVGKLTDFIYNSTFEGGSLLGWEGITVETGYTNSPSKYYGAIRQRDAYFGDLIPIEGGERLNFSIHAWNFTVSPQPFKFGVRYYDRDKNPIFWYVAIQSSKGNILEKHTASWVASASARYVRPWVQIDAYSNFTTWFFSQPQISRVPTNAQISMLENNINLRVTKGDLLSQINIQAGRTLIQSNSLVLDGNTVVKGDFGVSGSNVTLDANTRVQGNFTVSGGNVVLDGNTTVTGDFAVLGKNIILDGNTTVRDNFTVTGGNIILDGNTTVHNDFTVTGGNVVLNANTRVQGDFTVSGGNVILDGNTVVRGGFTVLGKNVTLDANTTILGDFSVFGKNIILDANTTVMGDFSVFGKNIILDGNTTVRGDFTVSGEIVGSGIRADNITTGELNSTIVNAISLNVSQLAGNTSNFVQSAWNGINTRININATALTASDSAGNQAIINTSGEIRSTAGGTDQTRGVFHKGRLWFHTTSGSAVLNIGSHPVVGEGVNRGSIATARAEKLVIGRYNDYLNTNPNAKVNPYITLEYGATLGDESNAFTKVWHDLSMSGKHINDVQQVSGFELAVRATSGRLMLGVTGYNTLQVGEANTRSFGNIEMQPGYEVTQASDRRWKDIVGKTETNALEEIKKLSVVDYYWKNGDGEKQFGLIAQDSPFLSVRNEDGYYGISGNKLAMLNLLSSQELCKRIEALEEEIKLLKGA